MRSLTEDFCTDISEDLDLKFDASNYPKDYPIYPAKNKKVIGMMKVESGGKQISEFVGLRAKLYSYKTDKYEKKKCKGITNNVIIKNIGFEDYKRTILTREIPHRRMNCVSSPNDELFI